MPALTFIGLQSSWIGYDGPNQLPSYVSIGFTFSLLNFFCDSSSAPQSMHIKKWNSDKLRWIFTHICHSLLSFLPLLSQILRCQGEPLRFSSDSRIDRSVIGARDRLRNFIYKHPNHLHMFHTSFILLLLRVTTVFDIKQGNRCLTQTQPENSRSWSYSIQPSEMESRLVSSNVSVASLNLDTKKAKTFSL